MSASGNATIGSLAKSAGVNVETVRYYQRIGLLEQPHAAPGSVRRYSLATLKKLRFIKQAQALGFSLDEVRLLLALSDGTHCVETRLLAEKKLEAVNEKIRRLTGMQQALERLVSACEDGSEGCGCPIIDALGNGD